jgi:mRNA-degrading endonuclease RelE of RelBE toxin-antitoxin system
MKKATRGLRCRENQARADVRAIDQQTAMRILHGLARFTQTEEGDVKRLQDIEPPEFRLRVGAYRIRFYDHGDSIEILAVKHRSEAYR